MKHNLQDALSDTAANWVARVLSGDLDDKEQEALEHWLEETPAGREVFDEMMEIAELAALGADQETAAMLERDLETYAAKGMSRRGWLIAAPALAASVAGAAVFFSLSVKAPDDPIRYATALGEMRQVTLEDGSRVELNTNSEISVSFDGDVRKVALDRGEAIFDVERNPDRPFIVVSKNATTRVLGTRFIVDSAGAGTTVSVLSGVVEVSPEYNAAQKDGAAITLIAGQQVGVPEASGDLEVVSFNADAATSWRRGIAYFENAPLIEVVTELNRYYAAKIELADDSLNAIPVTGGFDVQDQDIAIEALEVALSLQALNGPAGSIVLEASD